MGEMKGSMAERAVHKPVGVIHRTIFHPSFSYEYMKNRKRLELKLWAKRVCTGLHLRTLTFCFAPPRDFLGGLVECSVFKAQSSPPPDIPILVSLRSKTNLWPNDLIHLKAHFAVLTKKSSPDPPSQCGHRRVGVGGIDVTGY